MALAEIEATVTVTVYVVVVLSPADTVYVTGVVKLLGVVPLVWSAAPTFTFAPVVVNVAINAVTSVLFGMLTAIVFAVSSMTPVAPASEKAVTALAEFGATLSLLPLPPPLLHPATKATSSTTRNHNFEYPLHMFIFVHLLRTVKSVKLISGKPDCLSHES